MWAFDGLDLGEAVVYAFGFPVWKGKGERRDKAPFSAFIAVTFRTGRASAYDIWFLRWRHPRRGGSYAIRVDALVSSFVISFGSRTLEIMLILTMLNGRVVSHIFSILRVSVAVGSCQA